MRKGQQYVKMNTRVPRLKLGWLSRDWFQFYILLVERETQVFGPITEWWKLELSSAAFRRSKDTKSLKLNWALLLNKYKQQELNLISKW